MIPDVKVGFSFFSTPTQPKSRWNRVLDVIHKILQTFKSPSLKPLICQYNTIIIIYVFQTFSLAGFCAGITEGVLVNPFEVVKVTLQSHRGAPPSTLTVTRGIIQKDGYGLRGLNKGLTATLLRNGVFNMVYFGFYHSVKGYLPEFEVKLTCFVVLPC